MIRRLTSEVKIAGVHFSTLNLEKSVQRVIENLGWIERLPSVLKQENKLIAVSFCWVFLSMVVDSIYRSLLAL
jgi:hypothetical protein